MVKATPVSVLWNERRMMSYRHKSLGEQVLNGILLGVVVFYVFLAVCIPALMLTQEIRDKHERDELRHFIESQPSGPQGEQK